MPKPAAEHAQDEVHWQEERDNMVRTQIERRGVTDARVLEAMRTVPRHRLLPDRLRSQAYSDQAIPIGEGQTLSLIHI